VFGKIAATLLHSISEHPVQMYYCLAFIESDLLCRNILCVLVGGGTAGSVLASRLAEDVNRTILVIEAGGFPTVDPNIEVPIFADIVRNSDEFNWRYTTVPQKHACKGHVDQVGYSLYIVLRDVSQAEHVSGA